MQDFGNEVPPLELNLKKRYDSADVAVEKRRHTMSIKDQVHRLVGELGGLKQVISEGDVVLIKANASHPRPVPEGAVIDPQVVYALVEECFQAGAQEVAVGDGTTENKGTNAVFNELGYRPIFDKTGAYPLDLNAPPYIRVAVPFDNGLAFSSYIFSESLRRFDVLISAAKMKTHSEAQVTLGMKNLVGVPPAEPFFGASRKVFHKEFDPQLAAEEIGAKEMFRDYLARAAKVPGEKQPNERLCRVIVDLNQILPVAFTVIDGVLGMEGQGPWSGEAIATNVLVAGSNVLAVDTVSARLMGFDPENLLQVALARQVELGPDRMEEIETVGDEIEGLTVEYTPATSS